MANEKKTPTIIPGPSQLNYADAIIQMSFGAANTKITFGLEVADNTFAQATTIVMPTSKLLDNLNYVREVLEENEDVRQNISKGSNDVLIQLERMATSKDYKLTK